MVLKKACAMVTLAVLAGLVGLGGCGEEVPEPETPKQEDVCSPGRRICISDCERMGFAGLCFGCCKRKYWSCRLTDRYEFDECLQ